MQIYPQNKIFLSDDDFPVYDGKTITFGITSDCNLKCSYCYVHEKNEQMDMDLDMAKKIIDNMFAKPNMFFDVPLDFRSMRSSSNILLISPKLF